MQECGHKPKMEEINMSTGLLRSILFIFIFIRPVVVDIFQSFPKW